jgi:hypothetical protein
MEKLLLAHGEAPTRLQVYLCETHERLPASFKTFAWPTSEMYASTATLPPYAAALLWLRRTGSTAISPCTATTHHPVARAQRQPRRAPRLHRILVAQALPQHCRALRLIVTRTHRLYVNLAMRREYSSPGRSDSTSTIPYAAATSSFGRMTTSTTHLD